MSDRLALANAIEDAGIERAKAERVASVIFDAIHDNVATKADVQASEAAIRGELRAEISQLRAELKGEIVNVRSVLASETARLDTRIQHLDAKVEQVGSRTFNRLGTLMVVLSGIIIAALRYLPPPGHG
jgi:hypothetical protein